VNRRPGWLRALYESGELARQAAAASSWPDLARRLGCTYNALRKARDTERRAGLDLLELVQVGQAPTEPVPARWPSVEAFDRGELRDEPRVWLPSDFRNPARIPHALSATRKLTRDECPDGTTILWVSDVHIPIHNDPALRLMVECAERIGVSLVVAGGDIYDMNCLSRHPKESHRVVEHSTILEEIQPGRWLVDWFAKRNAKLILGNHEDRLKRFIDDNPAFHGSVLGNFARVVDLPAGIEVIPQGGEIRIGSLSMRHLDAEFKGGSGGQHPAAKLLSMLPAQSTIGGHLHRKAMACRTTRDEDGIPRTHAAWIMGHMSDESHHYSYVTTSPNWQTGFGVVRVWWDGERPRFSVYQVEVMFDRFGRPYFEFDGRLYHQARQVAA
jgi:hypothetical protein